MTGHSGISGTFIDVTAEDGFTFKAYQVKPQGTPRGGIVLIQEIFGVNPHIRSVADSYAADGYLVIAPALFDRAERGVELGYDEAGFKHGFALMEAMKRNDALADIAACVALASAAGKVGVVGFCWGGLMAFLAAGSVKGIAAAVAYYGGGIANNLDVKPLVPILFNFGEKDHYITPDQVAAVRAAFPDAPVYVYPADHGFNRDVGASYDKPSADLARERVNAFLGQYIG